MHVLALRIIHFQQFLNMGFFLCQSEVKNAELVLLSLHQEGVTKRSITSLLSSSLASLVRQRVVLTTVAVYPASPVQMAMSLMAVVLRRCNTTAVVGSKMPKKVA